MIRISQLANSVKPSATIAAGTKARQLKAAGIKVFDSASASRTSHPRTHLRGRGKGGAGRADALHADGRHRGRESRYLQVVQVVPRAGLHAENVIVSNGAKHSIHNALAATVGPGDEVINPTPYWVSYSDLVSMTGATPVLVNSTPRERVQDVARATARPHHPADAHADAQLAVQPDRHGVLARGTRSARGRARTTPTRAILSDEIYEQLTYGTAKPTCVATLRPWLKDRTITISGASKSYAMTGWRMGLGGGPGRGGEGDGHDPEPGDELPVERVPGGAGRGPQRAAGVRRGDAKRVRGAAGTHARAAEPDSGLKLPAPEGAFYAFFDVSAYFKKTFGGTVVADSLSFCNALLEQAHVNLVPGVAFGAEGFVRMSFATNRETIEAGLAKLKGVARHRQVKSKSEERIPKGRKASLRSGFFFGFRFSSFGFSSVPYALFY